MTELTEALLDPLFLAAAGASCAICVALLAYYFIKIKTTNFSGSPSSIFEDIKLLKQNPTGFLLEPNQHEKKPIVSTRKYERKADI